MGVLPMLQFATSFTFFIKADLRAHYGARPYSLHAIYSHGSSLQRKRALLREAHGWVDPPEYYGNQWSSEVIRGHQRSSKVITRHQVDPPEYYGATAAGAMPAQGSACGIPTSVVSKLVQARLCMQGAPQRYLVYGASLSERARRLGGFETILSQLKRFELAVRVASLTNRTLVLPRLRYWRPRDGL